MALVTYDNSDSSEFEDDDNESIHVEISNKNLKESIAVQRLDKEFDETHDSLSLFNFLPQPSNKKQSIVEDDDEFLHKKETITNTVKPRAKITVPSLSDFKDIEDSTQMKRPKISNGQKSGLLSILPQPRNGVTVKSTSLIPNVLTQKPNNTVKRKEATPAAKKAKAETKLLTLDYSDDSDDDLQNDFFSINKVEEPIEDLSLQPEPVMSSEVRNVPSSSEQAAQKLRSYFKPAPADNLVTSPSYGQSTDEFVDNCEESTSYESNHTTIGSTNEVALDEEAIRKLVGARGKRKMEEIEIVDVNQQEVLADAREWLMKGLLQDTTKRVSSSKRTGNEPTSQQRRKHQITYLAHQAKANEAELQNQWANNRMTKRQTQSKYGF